MEAGKELDAKVLAVPGWEPSGIACTDFNGNPWPPEPPPSLSTSDAEAVRLCLPWLVERNEGHPVTILAYRKHARVGVWSHIEFIDGGTLAHALCLAVIAVAEREAEQREPTT